MSPHLGRAVRWLRQWFSTAEALPNVGRNDPCWCGSGKKYKHCHSAEDQRRGTLTRNQTPNAQRQMSERAAKRTQSRGRKS